jgi:hypothetical protein
MKSKFVSGDHNVISDISGQKFKRSEMVFDWRGLLVHKETEFAPKHPQLNIRGRSESIAVTNGTRTQADDLQLLDPPFNPSGQV